MREGPSSEVLAGAFRWRPMVSAWMGTALLSAEVPVVSGSISADASQEVPERLTFTVPEWASDPDHPGGRSWVPDSHTHPLAEYGQHVDVDIRVWSSVTAASEDAEPTSVTRLGRFKVQAWEHDDTAGTVSVECVGVLQTVADARLRNPMVPRPGGTLASELRRLMVAGVPVQIDPALTDRACPRSFRWDEDRLAAMYEIADAWPARFRVDQYGVARMLPDLPDDPAPVLHFTDGQRGTVVGSPRRGTRDGIANVVVARSSATDDPARPPAQAVVVAQRGPLDPRTYGEVTFFWSSPLATTESQLALSARTILKRKLRPVRVRKVTAAPDPRVELDDPVSVETGRRTTTRWMRANAVDALDGGRPDSTYTDTMDGGGV